MAKITPEEDLAISELVDNHERQIARTAGKVFVAAVVVMVLCIIYLANHPAL